jgi:MauM/NapG family ferredoxin protein
MGAFDAEGRLMPEACNLCMDCVANCPHERAKVALRSPKKAPIALDPSRRAVLATLAAGFALPAFSWATRSDRPVHPKLIRPPGVLDERKFLDACVRCGECMKVCPTNGLQPALFEAGVEGVFSPRLVPRMGYCEFNCTLCSELCPTGAIPRLTQREKHIAVMGKAEFDRDHCLPFAKGKPCIVCEEHCPVPIKAIRFREAEATNEQGARVVVKQPYLVYDLCTGCGICEKKCPIEGLSAVRISRVEAVTPTQPGVPT